MASFQAKIDWGRPRKRENKNYRSVQTHNIKFQKNSRTIQKIKKIPLWLHFKPKLVVKRREREKIKIAGSFGSVSSRRVTENSKKIEKQFKNTIMASFQAKID